MASFRHAVSLGYRYLETDVHRTVDGVLVSFHDPDLNRTCGIDANIVEMTAAEVADARVLDPNGDDHPIPLLGDLFEEFPDARFNIDAKSDEAVEPLADLVRQVRRRRSGVSRIVQARAPPPAPRVCSDRNCSPTSARSKSPRCATVGRLRGTAPRAAQVPTSMKGVEVVNARFVASAHRLGVPVHVWTINERDEMERLLELGVDGIMTDETELLREVLIARGSWSAV